MKKIPIVNLFIILFLSSCVPKKVGNYSEIKTDGIRAKQEEFSIVGGTDRGEFLIGGPPVYIKAEVQNTSGYPFKNLLLNIDSLSSASVKFAPNSNGISVAPGQGGSCKLELAPGETCTFNLYFVPTNMGNVTQDLTLTYNNFVEPVKKSLKLSFVVGDYPNIIETNEKIRYDFGTIERMDYDKYYDKVVELQNVGGLSARNLTFELTNLVDGAYSIAKNTCSATLAAKEKCQITVRLRSPSTNFSSRTYTSDLLINYLKNPTNSPEPEQGTYAYNFLAYSTKLEGILAVQGVSSFSFPKIIHGNKAEVEFKLKNIGVKDIILRKILVYGPDGVQLGTCSRVDSTGKVNCVDMGLAPANLLNFPYSFKDINNCLVDSTLGDYERDPITKAFTINTPKKIAAQTETSSSEICSFKMIFHSSILNTANRDFKNWVMGFEYDNTFRDTKEIVKTTASLGARINIIMAQSSMGSKLIVSKYTINSLNYYNPPSPYIFDVGRIAFIQTTSTYSDKISYSLQNSNSTSPVKIKSISTEKDIPGQNFLFSNSLQSINEYFSGALLASNCKFNIAYTSNICDIKFNFSPKLLTDPQADPQAKLIGPVALSQGKTERNFIITYNNGCSINDDGTPCADKTISINFKANLVGRGNLEFNTTLSGASGAAPMNYNIGSTTMVSGKPLVGDLTWYYLWLENIGTATIPYIKTTALNLGFKSPGNVPYPFTIVPDSSGLAPDEYDCYNFLRGTPTLNAVDAIATTTPIAFPQAKKCRLKVESMVYPNEMITNYDSGRSEWRREFYLNRANNREYLYKLSYQENLGFDFYDNDLTATGALANFGKKQTILGGSTGKFTFKAAFAYHGKVVPIKPSPMISSVLYRPAFSLPAVPKHPNSQMSALLIQNIPSHVYSLQSFTPNSMSYPTSTDSIVMPGTTGLPAVGTKEAFRFLYSQNIFSTFNDRDYIFHAGSFPAQTGQEFLASLSLENNAYGTVNNLSVVLTCDDAPQGCSLPDHTIARGIEATPTTLAPLSGVTTVTFKINPSSAADVGLHEATLTVNFKNPLEKSIRIKILFNVVPNNKRISITSTDYECNDSVVPGTCNQLDAPTDITGQFLFNRIPNTGTKMIAVAGSQFYKKKKIEITNTGIEPITDLKIFFKESLGTSITSYGNAPLGYTITPASTPTSPSQCLSPFPVGQTCTLYITYKANSPGNFTQALGIGYRLVDGAGTSGSYINQFLDLILLGDNQASLTIENTATKTFNTISSYPISFKEYKDSNHPTLTTFPYTIFDSVPLINSPPIELLNIRPEKASLLRQYELYAAQNGLSMTPPVQAWVRIYKSLNNEIAIESNQGCFYGNDYSNAAIPADRKGFFYNDKGLSTGCRLRLLYEVGITKRGKINSADTIIPLKYYSSRRSSEKTVYLHLTGFIEPYRSQNATTIIKDVNTSSDGIVSFSWDNFIDETADYGNIDRYRVYYSKFGSDLLKIYDATLPNTLQYVDTNGTTNSATISGLEPGRYYYFQVVAMRRTNSLDASTEYISMPQTLPRKAVLVPPAGFAFDYISNNLIERSLYPINGETVSKTDAQNLCFVKKANLKYESIVFTKNLELLNSQVFDEIIMSESDTLINDSGNPANLSFSDHNFLEGKTWLNDNSDISILFPGYDCSQAVGFSPDNSASYIKSCDNNNPLNMCCDTNVLSQIRGMPLPASPTVDRLFTNFAGIKAQFRCFVKLAPQF